MKCPNCGFESDTAFCPMCGTQFSEVKIQDSTVNTENKPPVTYTEFTQAEEFAPQVQTQTPEIEINEQPILYIPQAKNTTDKKMMTKIVKIIAACIVGAVIVAGIAINIATASSGNSKSVFGDKSISDLVNQPRIYGGDYSTYY